MWQLVIAEFLYNIRLVIIAYTLTVLLPSLALVWGVATSRTVSMLALLPLMFGIIQMMNNRSLEKRDRLAALVPLPLWQVGVARALSCILFIAGGYLVLLGCLQVVAPAALGGGLVKELIFTVCILASLFSASFILYDMKGCLSERRSRFLQLAATVVLVLWLGALVFDRIAFRLREMVAAAGLEFLDSISPAMAFEFLGVGMVHLFTLALVATSVFVFSLRKTYIA